MVCGLMLFTSTMVMAGYSMSGNIFLIICAPVLAATFGLLVLSWLTIVLTLDRVGGIWEVSKTSGAGKLNGE